MLDSAAGSKTGAQSHKDWKAGLALEREVAEGRREEVGNSKEVGWDKILEWLAC
jgi:hypothetical protein